MRLVADLHIHSHYSRATSKDLTIPHLAVWAQRKGVHIVGTGDIAHPGWLAELRETLEPAEEGLFRLKPDVARAVADQVPPACQGTVRFILAGEISNIYKKNGRVRKIHNVVFLPSFDAAARLQAALERIGNIRADGRPILGLDARDLLEILLEVDERAFLIPAHIWTPWFSLLGSKSGFDSVEECFEDLTPHIFALETGLSSDPPMNWRVSALDRYTLVSASDAHSPQKLAREATLFDTDLSYEALRDAMRTGDPARFKGTIEFFPEEGKYHFDGHRKCGIVWDPKTTREHRGLCPVCGKPVTVGVMHRVEELADRPEGARKPNAHPFYSLIPLPEILAEVLNTGATSKRVRREYERLLATLGPELAILMDIPEDEIAAAGGARLAEAIARMRRGDVTRIPGFDGQYGVIKIFATPDADNAVPTLFEWEEPTRPAPTPDTTAPEPLPLFETAPATTAESAPAAEDDPLLRDLNPEQREAVRTVDRHLLIVAGPGTGKTHTLTTRLAYLVLRHNVPPEQILAITFTNKAAEEMAERLVGFLGTERARRLTVATFHALAARLLREWAERAGLPPTFVILDEEQRLWLLRQARPDLGVQAARRAVDAISRAKQQGLTPERLPTTTEVDPATWRAYEEAKQAAGALDFDDLLNTTIRLLEEDPDVRAAVHRRYRWIAVDEYQDLNAPQYRLLRLLAAGGANVCAIGDPDQAIYGFRGADRRYFLSFQEDFPNARVVRLTRNYRSAQNILDAALQVIRKSPDAQALRLLARWTTDVKITVHEAPTDRAEAEYVVHTIERLVGGTSYFSIDSGRVDDTQTPRRTFGDIAVLYRVRALSRPLIEALERSGIPYQTMGDAPPTARPRVQDALAHLWLLVAPTSQVHLARVLEAWDLQHPDLQAFLGAHDDLVHAWQAAARTLSLTPAQRERVNRLAAFWPQVTAPDLSVAERAARTWAFLGEHRPPDPEDERAWRLLFARTQAFDRDLRAFLEAVTLYAETDLYDPRADRVALLTLHAAKGLEFPVVFIVGCEDGLLPYRREGGPTDVDEERRLFYVGMTRAKERLILTHARRRTLYGERRQHAPSPFLADIETALKEIQAWQGRPAKRRARAPEAEQLSLWDV